MSEPRSESTHAGPLAGLRVIDLGHVVAAPTAAFQLASMGAEVIRVERPGGDSSWDVAPHVDGAGSVHETRGEDRVALAHLRRGRGKRSVVLDLKSKEGAGAFRSLARDADVVLENMRPGVLDRLGLGFETLRADNRGLIWCSITGYGSRAEEAGLAALDIAIQAQSGLIARTGTPDGPPTRAGALVSDHTSAVYAVLGILAALHERSRTGSGRRVEVAMIDVVTAMLWDEPHDQFAEAGLPVRSGSHDPRGAPSSLYPASDGWVAIITTNERQWATLADIIGRPDLAEPPTSAGIRARNRAVIDAAVTAWTSTRTRAEIERIIGAAGIPAGAVLEPMEAIAQPRIAERGLMEPLAVRGGSGASGYVAARMPVMFDGDYPTAGPAEPLGASPDATWSPRSTE